jgi:hypothetical protein
LPVLGVPAVGRGSLPRPRVMGVDAPGGLMPGAVGHADPTVSATQ